MVLSNTRRQQITNGNRESIHERAAPALFLFPIAVFRLMGVEITRGLKINISSVGVGDTQARRPGQPLCVCRGGMPARFFYVIAVLAHGVIVMAVRSCLII